MAASCAAALHERIGAKRGIAPTCINLGDLHWQDGRGDWNEANAQWQRARRLYEEIGDQHGLALTLRNLGEAHLKLGEFDVVCPAAKPRPRPRRSAWRRRDANCYRR